MVLIPKKESQRVITSLSPSIRIGEEAFVSRDLQDIGKTISATALAFQTIAVENESTKADTDSRRKLKELEFEAETSEDLDPQIFEQRIQAIREETSAGMKLPLARSKFQQQFERNSLISGFNIRRTLNNRQVDLSIATLKDNLDAQESEFINASSIVERNKVILDMQSKIDERIKQGVLKAEEGRKLKDKTLLSWQEAQIDNDVEDNPELALTELLAGKNGKYTEVPVDTRTKSISIAEKMVKRRKEITDVQQNTIHTANELNMMKNYFEGTLTIDDIKTSDKENQISPEFTKAQFNAATSSKAIKAKTDDEIWNELLDDYYSLDESDLDKLREFRTKVLNKSANGNVSLEDSKFLFDKTIDPFTPEKEEKKNFLFVALETVSNWTVSIIETNPFKLASIMKKSIINKVEKEKIEGEKINEVTKEVITEAQRAINPNRKQYEIGQTIETNAGPGIIKDFDIDGEPLIELIKTR